MHIFQQAADDLKLMIAREIERFPLFAGLVLLHRELGVMLDDVAEAVAGEDFLPEIGTLVAIGIDRVTFALSVGQSLVEWQEIGALAIDLGRHPHIIGIHGEMHEAAAELEQGFLRVAVVAVLFLGVIDVLACPRVFQLQRGERQAIEEKHHVHRLVIDTGEKHLPRDRKNVGLELGSDIRVEVVVGQPIEQREVSVVHIQPLFQHGENAVLLQLAVQAFENLALPVRLVVELGEFRCLCGFEKLPEHGLVDGVLGVEIRGLATQVSRSLVGTINTGILRQRSFGRTHHTHSTGEVAFDAGFKGRLVGLRVVHRAFPAATITDILPLPIAFLIPAPLVNPRLRLIFREVAPFSACPLHQGLQPIRRQGGSEKRRENELVHNPQSPMNLQMPGICHGP